MRFVLPLLLAGALAEEMTSVKVDVYEGPTECEDVERVKDGDMLSMHYTGKIDETSSTGVRNKQFDSSRKRDDTFKFVIGMGEVIKGWDQGLLGLCKGAKATLVVPPELGYGNEYQGGPIPGGATLHFDVEVMEIGTAPPPRDIFSELDVDRSGDLTVEEILAHYKGVPGFKGELPKGLMEQEDKDGDGKV